MNRAGTDPKVKKTLVRNCENKITSKTRKEVVRDVAQKPVGLDGDDCSRKSQKNKNMLSEPMLCSSTALANYLADVKRSLPPQSNDDLDIDTGEMCSKMTKKLNYHVNDKIYKNLIELNASIEETKVRKDKRPSTSSVTAKRDLEPDIEDFCEDVIEPDIPPRIPAVKPKFKPLRSIENGHLHKLVASFEIL